MITFDTERKLQDGRDVLRCVQLETEGRPPTFVRDATPAEWHQAAALGRPMPVAQFHGDLAGNTGPVPTTIPLQVRVEMTLPMLRYRCGAPPLIRVVLGTDTISDVLLDPETHDVEPVTP